MTDTITPAIHSETSHGTTIYYDEPLAAAEQASLDVATYTGKLTNVEGVDVAPVITAAGISAMSNVALAVVGAGQLGTMIGTMVNGISKPSGQLAITVTNYTSTPVVPYDYSASGGPDVSNVPNPLSPGETDSYMITQSAAFNGGQIRLDFLVGAGSTATIPFSVYLQYSSGGPWTVGVAVDGSNEHTFQPAKQMFGFTFTGDTAGIPNFSAYITPIETGNGMISLMICDKGSGS